MLSSHGGAPAARQSDITAQQSQQIGSDYDFELNIHTDF